MNRKGFTLIELMIVIAIICIGLSIVIPNIVALKEGERHTENQIVIEQTDNTVVLDTSDDFNTDESRY